MGRGPQGEEALTGAERQARYRLRLGAASRPPSRQAAGSGPARDARRPPRGLSLARRWSDAVAELVSLQAEYERWLEALPEATRGSAAGEALQAMVELDLEDIIAINPPRGFGRD